MKIKYQFVTGETVEIKVSERIGKVLIAIDKDMQNSDRRETRRHNSIDALAEQGIQVLDNSIELTSAIEARETKEALHDALNKLLPQQRELIQKVFFAGKSISEIAREEGVYESAIRNRLSKTIKRMKKFLD